MSAAQWKEEIVAIAAINPATGMVFVNGNVTSYPELPFGGIGQSGHGRELSWHGIREFCNAKSVWIGAPRG